MIIKSLITARGNSKSIRKKNISLINGKPLIYYAIDASKKSNVNETWVSTANIEIKNIALSYGAKVIDRPLELSTDSILNEPALIHFAEKEDFDWIVFIQPTSPFIKHSYIDKAIKILISGSYDSIFTATKKHWTPKWNLEIKPIDWNIKNRPRRQDKEEYYEENGMFYITSKKQLLKSGLRYGGNIGILDIPCYDSLQIDTIDDLNLTKKILEK